MSDRHAPVSLVLARMAARSVAPSDTIATSCDETLDPSAGSDDDFVAVSHTVIRWARDAAQHRAELERARDAHERPLVRSAQSLDTPHRSAGEATMRAFRELEREAQ